MKKLLFFVGFITQITFGQDVTVLTLEECYRQTIATYPLKNDKRLVKDISALKIENLNLNYLPRFDLSAQASYQSDVTMVEVDLSIPVDIEFPRATKDQYKVSMDISQVIFDGGVTKRQKELELKTLDAGLQQIEVSLYKLKESVNRVYFSILFLQEQEEILSLIKEVLVERKKIAESGVRNGVITLSDLQAIKAEKLKIEQQLIELESGRNTAISVLSELMDTVLPVTVQLEYPEFQIDYDSDRNRPELILFRNQLAQIDASSNLLKTKRLPKLFAFGLVGYGRPGLNFLNDEFDTYYLVGAKLSWNLFDWNQNKRERKILAIQKDRVVTQRDIFNERINIEIEKKRSEVKKYEKLIASDNEIIKLRKAIVETSASKFDNGVITSIDYLNDLNAEKQARINRELHNVQLMQARADYIVIKGKKDEGME